MGMGFDYKGMESERNKIVLQMYLSKLYHFLEKIGMRSGIVYQLINLENITHFTRLDKKSF